jgi:hypothetical protein
MRWIRVFLAGFLATNLHQAALHGMHLAGASPRGGWSLAPTEPFGVPQFLSLSFWAGLWAIALWLPARRFKGGAFWAWWILAGAIGPSLVALLVVFPLKGQAFAAGGDVRIWIAALVLNAIWGLGTAMLLKAFRVAP